MKNNLALLRIIGIRFLALCASTLLLICFAHGQSSDDVNIIPLNSRNNLDSNDHSRPIESLPAPNPNDKPLHVDVDVVLVPVTVSDSQNRPVTALKRQDFALFEENQRQEIRYFSAEESPISVAILLDVSKSMSDKIDPERAAIVEFFNNANPADEYFAITFSARPRVLASSTQSINELQQKLMAIDPGGPTAMLDAIYLAESKLRSARYERKAIVIISDGGDNASRYTLREIKSLVQESDVQIYAIGLFDTFFVGTLEEKLGKKWLSEITDTTGGRTITVDSSAKIPEAAATLSREMRNQYVLGYRPGVTGVSRWRKIKVYATQPGTQQRLHAHYKTGYISPGKVQSQNRDPF
jgi:Ca-activated chloride channel family protein